MTLKILIVDDDPAGLQTAEAILDGQGYKLEFAESGAEALEKARKFLPDVILLDVMMPGMSGFEVCEEIRKDEVLSEAIIFFLTALDDRQSLVTAVGLGADEFITKPYDPEELRARLIGLTWSNRHLQA